MEGCRGQLTRLCDARPWCRPLLGVALLQGPDDLHGLGHTLRVLCNALWLLEEEKLEADLDIVIAASLLHDVGRILERWTGLHHAVLSAEIARVLLPLLGFPGEKVERVASAILEHSFSLGGRPSSPESCVLSDADKLDALGAIGFARMIAYGQEAGRLFRDSLRHFREKLEKLPGLMCTEAGRRAAAERLEKLRAMVVALEGELEAYFEAYRLLDESVKALKPGGRLAGGGGGQR